MLARPYDPKDARACDRLLENNHGITDPTKDHIVVAGELERPEGILVYREAAYVHELECGGSRLRADALGNYAVACARAKGLRSAVFLIRAGNQRMHRWAEGIGAVKQTEPGDVLYLLTPF